MALCVLCVSGFTPPPGPVTEPSSALCTVAPLPQRQRRDHAHRTHPGGGRPAGATILATTAIGAEITGAGATFPYPIYAKWAEAYKQQTGTGLNYQSIGSGGGIKQITAKTVDFGASDMPLKPEDLAKERPRCSSRR